MLMTLVPVVVTVVAVADSKVRCGEVYTYTCMPNVK